MIFIEMRVNRMTFWQSFTMIILILKSYSTLKNLKAYSGSKIIRALEIIRVKELTLNAVL